MRSGFGFLDDIGAMFWFCREKISGKGEDSCCFRFHEQGGVMAVFDGCGGLGAQSYERASGHSGSYLASRVAAAATMRWFEGQPLEADLDFDALKAQIVDGFSACERTFGQGQSKLVGTLVRPMPTTAAMLVFQHDLDRRLVTSVSAGDSHLYYLGEEGLRQLNVDDLANEDAFSNLYHDAPMTNVVAADGSFDLNLVQFDLMSCGVYIAATDGCFGYLKSPMEFEFMLLGTLFQARNVDEWQLLLESAIDEVAGDDQTFLALVLGHSSLDSLKESLNARFCLLQDELRSMPDAFEARASVWQRYRQGYYSLIPGGAIPHG